MVNNMRLRQTAGGNRHPIPVKQFIIDRLARVGEDYYGGLHQAYKEALDQLARDRRRKYLYHHPTYFSFFKKVKELITARIVEPSGREEESDNPQFNNWEHRPIKKFVRLARGR